MTLDLLYWESKPSVSLLTSGPATPGSAGNASVSFAKLCRVNLLTHVLYGFTCRPSNSQPHREFSDLDIALTTGCSLCHQDFTTDEWLRKHVRRCEVKVCKRGGW